MISWNTCNADGYLAGVSSTYIFHRFSDNEIELQGIVGKPNSFNLLNYRNGGSWAAAYSTTSGSLQVTGCMVNNIGLSKIVFWVFKMKTCMPRLIEFLINQCISLRLPFRSKVYKFAALSKKNPAFIFLMDKLETEG